MKNRVIELRTEYDIVLARQAGRDLARELGFGTADQTRLATAISELARNAIQYAGGGICTVTDISEEGSARLRVVVEDSGPGIADLEAALEGGRSTGKGLGAGLSGARRLVHHFDIQTRPGLTRITLMMNRIGGLL